MSALPLVPFPAVTAVYVATFIVATAMILLGAVGVISSENPVHSALNLVLTLFGVAVVFVSEQADFLAAVQVIVYAGAIVVLFLFVIMFLGVDRREDLTERLRFQWWLAAPAMLLVFTSIYLLLNHSHWAVGPSSVAGPASGQKGGNVAALGRSVFTTYLFPFEVTAGLLVIAIVGAVMLSRRPIAAPPVEDDGPADGDVADEAGEPDADGPDDEEPDEDEDVALADAPADPAEVTS